MELLVLATAKENEVRAIRINCDKFQIGRSLQNSYIIENINISRTHCVLEKINGDRYIKDESTNGIMVNGQLLDRMTKYKLQKDDRIRLIAGMEYIYTINDDNGKTNESSIEEEFDNFTENILPKVEASLRAMLPISENSKPPTFINKPSTTAAVPTIVSALSMPGTLRTKSASTAAAPSTVASSSTNELASTSTVASASTAAAVSTAIDLAPELNFNMDQVEDELQCSICTEMFIKATTLNCSHTFCAHCLYQWQKHHMVCPICRAKITSECSTLVVDNFIQKALEAASEEVKERRRKIIAERELVAISNSSSKTATKRPRPLNRPRTRTRTRRNPLDPDAVTIEISSSEDEDNVSQEDLVAYIRTHVLQQDENGEQEYNYLQRWNLTPPTDPYQNYNGIPGRYYGGYGNCYMCGSRGHWANGCPNKAK